MDDVDIAQTRIEAELENLIAEHIYQLGHAVSAYEVGRCRNCGDKTDDSRAFCDMDCSRDFEDRQRADRRNGKYRGG